MALPFMDLNSASVEELADLPGVTLSCAYDLMLWRPYLSWAEVEGAPPFFDVDFTALRAAGLTLEAAGWVGGDPDQAKISP